MLSYRATLHSSSSGGRICPLIYASASQFFCGHTRGTVGVWTALARRCPVQWDWACQSFAAVWLRKPNPFTEFGQLGRASKRSHGELIRPWWYLKSSCSEHLSGVICWGLQTVVLHFLCVWPQHNYRVTACRMHKFLQFHTRFLCTFYKQKMSRYHRSEAA